MDSALTAEVKAAAAAAGFPGCGICRLADIPRRLPSRAAAELPENGSIAVMPLPYYTGEYPGRNVALYAIPDDYHAVAAARLGRALELLRGSRPEHRWLGFADASPIPEKAAAAAAGLGTIGLNSLLITREYGSLCFLAEIITDAELVPDKPLDAPLCTGCGECARRCPTGAITPQGVDRSLCLSAITQKKGELSDREREAVAAAGLVWGCDICTLACPGNAAPKATAIEEFLRCPLPVITPDNIAENLGRKSWGWRGEAVIRRNLDITAKEAHRRG